MKAIKKISVTPVKSYTGQIIDSMTTSSNKHTNAPSINAVENALNLKANSSALNSYYDKDDIDDKLSVSHTTITFKDSTNTKTFTAEAYKYGKVVTIYFDFNLQALADSLIINANCVPAGYRPKHIVSVYYGEDSTYSNWITFIIKPDGYIAGSLNGANNESGSYLRDYPCVTYVVE